MAASFALVEGNAADVDLLSFKLRKVAKRRLAHRDGIGRIRRVKFWPLQRSQAVGLLDFPFVSMGKDVPPPSQNAVALSGGEARL